MHRFTAAKIAPLPLEPTPAPGPNPLRAALQGLCPRCGAKGLFNGLLAFAPACRACGLDYASFNVGDGAAAFGTLIIGALATIGGATLQIMVAPPLWVQMAIWIPLTTLGVIGFLRVAKAALIGAEYRNAARQGRIKQ